MQLEQLSTSILEPQKNPKRSLIPMDLLQREQFNSKFFQDAAHLTSTDFYYPTMRDMIASNIDSQYLPSSKSDLAIAGLCVDSKFLLCSLGDNSPHKPSDFILAGDSVRLGLQGLVSGAMYSQDIGLMTPQIIVVVTNNPRDWSRIAAFDPTRGHVLLDNNNPSLIQKIPAMLDYLYPDSGSLVQEGHTSPILMVFDQYDELMRQNTYLMERILERDHWATEHALIRNGIFWASVSELNTSVPGATVFQQVHPDPLIIGGISSGPYGTELIPARLYPPV